jgi:putative ABC transport system substrate-binding protein
MLQNFDASDVDLILPMTTPVISSACGMVRRKPVVFTYCSDPIAAGAGKSFTNHLAHVTGIGSFPPVQDMVDLIHATLPQAKSIGTIYNASEANSVKVVRSRENCCRWNST